MVITLTLASSLTMHYKLYVNYISDSTYCSNCHPLYLTASLTIFPHFKLTFTFVKTDQMGCFIKNINTE